MKDDALKKNLRQSLHQSSVDIDEEHLAKTLALTQKEICLKQQRERISFTRFLLKQIKFIGYKVWIIQGIFLLFINGILSRLYGSLVSPQNVIKLLFSLSVLVFMTAPPFIYRSVRYQMQEIETASRFSSVKLLLAKLIVIGIGDISLLGGIFFTTIARTTLSAQSAALYLCCPFLIACSGCLFMLAHLNPRQFLMGSLLFCSILVMVFYVIPGHYMFWFQHTFMTVWAVISALLLVFCAWQLRCITRDSSYQQAIFYQ